MQEKLENNLAIPAVAAVVVAAMVAVAAVVVASKLGPVVEDIAVLEVAPELETAAVAGQPAAEQPLVVVVVVAAVVVGTASV